MTEIYNRPGQQALQYRIGTFGSFREAMLREAATRPEIAALTTRESDDFAVATLEMWASLADILTFYQERYVQEAYLRTAVHRDSLARLGALLAYRPRPGVAAETLVAFTVEAATDVPLAAGIRIQSAPGPGEEPLKYESVEPVVARPALNRAPIYPLPVPANPFRKGSSQAILMPGTLPESVRPGTRLLWTSDSEFSALEKQVVGLKTEGPATVLTFDPPFQDDWVFASTHAYVLRGHFRLFGHNAPPAYVPADARPTVKVTPAQPNPDGSYTGPQISVTQPAPVATDYNWSHNYIDLDGSFDGLKDNTRVLIVYDHPTTPGVTQTLLATVTSVVPATASIGAAGNVTPYARASVTRVHLNQTVTLRVDKAVVYELGDPLLFWGAEYPEWLAAGSSSCYLLPGDLGVPPATAAALFERGRRLLLTDGSGPPESVTVSGAALIPAAEPGGGHLAVAFRPALSRPLRVRSAVLHGNVARATHGERVAREVLGSGDPSQPGQSFTLKKAPVTFRQSADGAGFRSTLTITVDDVTWTEVDSFHGTGPNDRVYVTDVDEQGAVTVRFGNGTHGARLPRGAGNVVAAYRRGSGAAGAVRPGTLTSLLDRPRGLRGVTNPSAATGGRDPESSARLREALPATVQTFGRAISTRDIEVLAISFPGVAKARAATVWSGWRKALHLTVAGTGGGPVDREALKQFLDARRDPHQALSLSGYTPRPVTLALRLQVAPAYDGPAVEAAVRRALAHYFAFDSRTFGEPVYRSDIYQAVQAVPGVAALAVDRLDFAGSSGNREELPISPTELAVVLAPDTDLVVERRESL